MIEIKQGVELPRKKCRGRPKGIGRNIELLKKLKPGDTAWNIGLNRMMSIVHAAKREKISITYRKIPGTRSYAFKINQKEPDDI